MVRTTVEAQSVAKKSSFVLLVDLVAAFYKIIKQFVVSLPHDHDDLMDALGQAQLPPAVLSS
eukprot:1623115-Pyramimonas_sp.AAC.1